MGHIHVLCGYYRNASTSEDAPVVITPSDNSTSASDAVSGPITDHSTGSTAIFATVPTNVTDSSFAPTVVADDEEGNKKY